jgi:hypothetical protein
MYMAQVLCVIYQCSENTFIFVSFIGYLIKIFVSLFKFEYLSRDLDYLRFLGNIL